MTMLFMFRNNPPRRRTVPDKEAGFVFYAWYTKPTMFSLFFRKKKREKVLILDLAEFSWGAALVEYEAEKKPRILRALRSEWKGKPLASFSGLEAFSDFKPTRIVCYVAPVFGTRSLQKVSETFPAPRTIKEGHLDALVARELQKIQAASDVVDMKVVHVRLNGYSIDHPFGKHAENLEATLVFNSVPKTFRSGIQSALPPDFRKIPIEIHTASFLVFTFVRDILSKDARFLAVHLGQKATEVVRAEHGDPEEPKAFDFGVRDLLYLLARDLNTVPGEIESLLKLYYEKKLRPEIAGDVDRALLHAQKAWETFFLKLAGLSSQGASVFIAGDHRYAPLFLKSEGVRVITPEFLSEFCLRTPESYRDADVFLMLETIVSRKDHA